MENGDDRTQSTAQVAPFYSGALAPNHSGVDTVAQFLAADKSDPEALARLKNGLEAVGVGVALEGLTHGISAIKAWRSGDTSAAVDAAKAAADSAEASKAGVTTSDTLKAPQGSPGGAPEATPWSAAPSHSEDGSTGQGATPLVPKSETLLAPKRIFSPEEVGQIADSIVGDKKANLSDPYSVVPTDDPNMAVHNLKYVIGTDDEKQLATTLGQKIRERLDMSSSPEDNTFAAVKAESDQIAETFGVDPEYAFRTIAKTAEDVKQAKVIAAAANTYVNSLNQSINKMAGMLAEGRIGQFATIEDLKSAFDHAVSRHIEVGGPIAELGSGSGSLLNIQKVLTEASSSIADNVQKAKLYGGDNPEAKRSLLVQHIYNGDGSAVTNGQFISPLRSNLVESLGNIDGAINQGTKVLAGYYINSLLGFKTIAVKGTSDLLKGGIVQPLEQAYRGIYRGATTKDWTALTQAGQQYVGMVSALFDGIKLAGRTVWRSPTMQQAGLEPGLFSSAGQVRLARIAILA